MIFPQLIQFSDFGLFLLRFVIGIIFLTHGMQKWGMWRMKASPEMPSKMINMMKMLSLVEPAAGTAMILGFFSQLAAIVLILVMAGAIYLKVVVWKKKFTEPGGWEFDLLLLTTNLAILFLGGGSIGI
ncbi:MAG: DoxX family protein [Candidatus Nealsonbacteria bacterium]|nr:DoxX family protein [Candidatus Nealsonbacteria bacterium]